MTVGRILVVCWTVYGVMCAAFLPLGAAIYITHLLPAPALIVVIVIVVGALWWGPFAYAMYLSIAVMKNGDRRLIRRGIRGTAVVLRARATATTIHTSGSSWQNSRVYSYRLRVTVPGREPYETKCSLCASWITEGSTVDVAVSPHNHKRVMIDVGQASGEMRPAVPHGHVLTIDGLTTYAAPQAADDEPQDTPGWHQGQPESRPQPVTNADLVAELTQLGRLHRDGVLTDEEFATAKARLLGE
jgi:hypothetical protein